MGASRSGRVLPTNSYHGTGKSGRVTNGACYLVSRFRGALLIRVDSMSGTRSFDTYVATYSIGISGNYDAPART